MLILLVLVLRFRMKGASATYISWFTLLLLCVLVLGNPPIDTPSRCGNARKPANGNVRCSRESDDALELTSGGKSSSGSSSKGHDIYTCRYACDKGYQLNGPAVLECPIDKITDNPTCAPVECNTLPAINHGSLNCSQGFQFGSICQYACAPGYDISGGSKLLSCGVDGMWKGVVPMCEPVQCPPLSEPSHGSLSCPNGRTFGSDCRYTCDDRYVLDGPAVATCSANGYWSLTAAARTPTCKLGECTPLPLLVHGSLTCTKGWDIGTLCSYSCHGGFSLTGGNYLHSCRYNGYWRGDLPTCERGNSTETEFVLYDIFDDKTGGVPSGIVGPDSSDTGGASGGNIIGAPAIVAIIAVVVILLAVVAGLFVAHRTSRRSNEGYGTL